MGVFKTELPKKLLASMPIEDRQLFLALGHVINEINLFQKLMLTLRRDDPPSKLVEVVEAGQVLIVMRVLIGKLHEAHRFFKECVQGDRTIRERYNIDGEWEGRALLKALNARFGKGSMLSRIRNKVSFHYVDEDGLVERSFQALPEGERWEFYLGDVVANTFYYASEMVVMRAALELVDAQPEAGKSVDEAKLHRLFDEMVEVAGVVMELSQVLMMCVIDKCGLQLEAEEIDVGPLKRLRELNLPFFVDDRS